MLGRDLFDFAGKMISVEAFTNEVKASIEELVTKGELNMEKIEACKKFCIARSKEIEASKFIVGKRTIIVSFLGGQVQLVVPSSDAEWEMRLFGRLKELVLGGQLPHLFYEAFFFKPADPKIQLPEEMVSGMKACRAIAADIMSSA
eukprot:4977112-Lingulodinium_polyedra.AAC.1